MSEKRWGRWKLPPDRPFGLVIELGDDVVVGVDFIGLRDEWESRWAQELAATPGITKQDMTDIEQARRDLAAEGEL